MATDYFIVPCATSLQNSVRITPDPLEERPSGALQNDAEAKALLNWAATEREAWLEAVTNDPLRRAGFCRPITWGNRRGGRLLTRLPPLEVVFDYF